MSHHDRHLRRLATVVAALSLAAIAAGPAGAWPDPYAGDGSRQGSMPSTEAQAYLAKKQPVRSSPARKAPRTRANPGNCRRPTAVAKKSGPACRTRGLTKAGTAK